METDRHYHIYNHANGNENIFMIPENYHFFLRRYKKFMFPVVETFCYCLMPNHFHFLIKVRTEQELLGIEKYNRFKNPELFVSKQFSNLFSSYTQAFNKQQGRRGNLFMRPFKRNEVTKEPYFRKLIHYIHRNPVEAGFCNHPKEWDYSSYNPLISKKPTLLKRNEVLAYFDSVENFEYVHSLPSQWPGMEDF